MNYFLAYNPFPKDETSWACHFSIAISMGHVQSNTIIQFHYFRSLELGLA